MKFLWLVIALLFTLITSEASAQAISIQKTALWDAPVVDSSHGAASSYEVRVNGNLVGSPVATTQVLTFTALGNHTISVVAVNAGGSSPPLTLVYNVVLPVPNAPGNLRIVDSEE